MYAIACYYILHPLNDLVFCLLRGRSYLVMLSLKEQSRSNTKIWTPTMIIMFSQVSQVLNKISRPSP